MKTIWLQVFVCFFLFLSAEKTFSQEDARDLIKINDLRTYYLKDAGITDIVFSVASDQVLNIINQSQIFGKIEWIKFRYYWSKTLDKKAVEIEGLPAGFLEQKNSYKSQMIGKLDLVLGQTLMDRLDGYKLILQKEGKGESKIVALDSSGLKHVSEYHVYFTAKDILRRIEAYSPSGHEILLFNYNNFPWSKGKYVLTRLEYQNRVGEDLSESVYDLMYGLEGSWGVLQSLSLKQTETRMILDPSGEKKAMETHVETKFIFHEYLVNKQAGREYFINKKR